MPSKKLNILMHNNYWRDDLKHNSIANLFFTDLSIDNNLISDTCRKLEIDLILCVDHKINILKATAKMEGLPWRLPNIEAVRMEDKFFAREWFLTNDFASLYPKEKSLRDWPYILKTDNSSGGSHVFYIRNQDELNQIKVNPKQFICQEYIDSPFEYVYHFVAKDGDILESVTYQHNFTAIRRKQQQYIRGVRIRNTTLCKYNLPKKHEQAFINVIGRLNYTGLGAIDFKLTSNGLKIIEVNTRMGGSLLFYDDQANDFIRFMNTYMKLFR